jgi:hypothetical protein
MVWSEVFVISYSSLLLNEMIKIKTLTLLKKHRFASTF